jgi:outer membrane biosynthesis protein TonB
VGKDLFLRGGYLDNTLEFNEHGALIGHSPLGSYTLCGIRINRVRLLRHKLELGGERYALHFLGARPDEDPTQAVDRVNITPKKRAVRITIDRELVVNVRAGKGKKTAWPWGSRSAPTTASPVPEAAPGQSTASAPASAATNDASSDAEQAQAAIAEAPAAERPADIGSITTTHSQDHANRVLETALDDVFSEGLDARMMAAMPPFWRLYYEAAAEKSDYRPKDPSVFRQSAVDKKARLVTALDPASNQFAQDYGVAGMAEYHVVVGADGKPQEIAVARPIGFGLDENAADTLRKATFEPAVKDGKPVAVMLDMIVEFRIYSGRTAETSQPAPVKTPEAAILPGPYSVQHQVTQ